MRKLLVYSLVGQLVLGVQVVLALYSNPCNKTALILENKELGLRGSEIPDSHFDASSFSDNEHKPWRGRLDQVASGNQASSWCAKFKDKNQWLWVDLGEIAEVTDIATQGQYDPVNETSKNFSTSWVTQYRVDYSSDNKTFFTIDYKYERPLLFKGNNNGTSVECNKFPYNVKTRYVRVHPVEWDKDICLRVGLFGKIIGGSIPSAFFTPDDRPDHETWWWWILFWSIFSFLLLIAVLGFLIYCCIIRRRTYSQEKVIKEKPLRVPTRRDHDSFANNVYGVRMSVITTDTSMPDTPRDTEDPGDEVQEVTADFSADDHEHRKGIIGFSVTDDSKGGSNDESNNDDVDWENYKQKAMSQRSLHIYENLDLGKGPGQ